MIYSNQNSIKESLSCVQKELRKEQKRFDSDRKLAENEIEKFKVQINNLTNQIAVLQRATSSGQNTLKDQLTEKIGEIVGLQDELVTMKGDFFKTKSSKEQLERSVKFFEEQIQAEKTKSEILLGEQKNNAIEIQRLQSKISDLQKEKIGIDGSHKNTINQLEKTIDCLKKEKLNLNNDKEQNTTLLESFKNQLEKVMREATEAENTHLVTLKEKDQIINSMEKDLAQELFRVFS